MGQTTWACHVIALKHPASRLGDWIFVIGLIFIEVEMEIHRPRWLAYWWLTGLGLLGAVCIYFMFKAGAFRRRR